MHLLLLLPHLQQFLLALLLHILLLLQAGSRSCRSGKWLLLLLPDLQQFLLVLLLDLHQLLLLPDLYQFLLVLLPDLYQYLLVLLRLLLHLPLQCVLLLLLRAGSRSSRKYWWLLLLLLVLLYHLHHLIHLLIKLLDHLLLLLGQVLLLNLALFGNGFDHHSQGAGAHGLAVTRLRYHIDIPSVDSAIHYIFQVLLNDKIVCNSTQCLLFDTAF